MAKSDADVTIKIHRNLFGMIFDCWQITRKGNLWSFYKGSNLVETIECYGIPFPFGPIDCHMKVDTGALADMVIAEV